MRVTKPRADISRIRRALSSLSTQRFSSREVLPITSSEEYPVISQKPSLAARKSPSLMRFMLAESREVRNAVTSNSSDWRSFSSTLFASVISRRLAIMAGLFLNSTEPADTMTHRSSPSLVRTRCSYWDGTGSPLSRALLRSRNKSLSSSGTHSQCSIASSSPSLYPVIRHMAGFTYTNPSSWRRMIADGTVSASTRNCSSLSSRRAFSAFLRSVMSSANPSNSTASVFRIGAKRWCRFRVTMLPSLQRNCSSKMFHPSVARAAATKSLLRPGRA